MNNIRHTYRKVWKLLLWALTHLDRNHVGNPALKLFQTASSLKPWNYTANDFRSFLSLGAKRALRLPNIENPNNCISSA